jgi:hypothetical protein
MPAFLEQGFPIPKADGMIGLRNGFACAVAILNLAAAAAAPGPQGELIYKGMADASAAVPVGDGLFVVADDETNSLRVYRRDRGGFPIQSVNLDNFLGTDLAARNPTRPISKRPRRSARPSTGSRRMAATRPANGGPLAR